MPGARWRATTGTPAPVAALNALLPDDIAVLDVRAGASGSTPAATRPAGRTATGCWRAASAARSSAAGRCTGPSRVDRDAAATRARRRWSGRTTSPPSPRPRPSTSASSARCSPRTGGGPARRAARVLDRGRRVHAPHEPRAGGNDARGGGRAADAGATSSRCSADAPRSAGRADRARRTGCTWSGSGYGGASGSSAARAGPSLRLASDPMRVLLTNDDGIEAAGPAGAAPRAAAGARRSSWR